LENSVGGGIQVSAGYDLAGNPILLSQLMHCVLHPDVQGVSRNGVPFSAAGLWMAGGQRGAGPSGVMQLAMLKFIRTTSTQTGLVVTAHLDRKELHPGTQSAKLILRHDRSPVSRCIRPGYGHPGRKRVASVEIIEPGHEFLDHGDPQLILTWNRRGLDADHDVQKAREIRAPGRGGCDGGTPPARAYESHKWLPLQGYANPL
jgi:hypothetical protein